MLGKALLNLDQVGFMLDPTFNPNDAIRESAAEIMQRRMQKSLSPGHLFQIFGYPGIAIIFFSIAAIGALALMVQIMRDDRST